LHFSRDDVAGMAQTRLEHIAGVSPFAMAVQPNDQYGRTWLPFAPITESLIRLPMTFVTRGVTHGVDLLFQFQANFPIIRSASRKAT
jgi:hypothetical protein